MWPNCMTDIWWWWWWLDTWYRKVSTSGPLHERYMMMMIMIGHVIPESVNKWPTPWKIYDDDDDDWTRDTGKCQQVAQLHERYMMMMIMIGHVIPERVNRWPNCMTDIWWWWWLWLWLDTSYRKVSTSGPTPWKPYYDELTRPNQIYEINRVPLPVQNSHYINTTLKKHVYTAASLQQDTKLYEVSFSPEHVEKN